MSQASKTKAPTPVEYTAADGPPAYIVNAMGGRQFFFEIGAQAIHRIGIHKGLGWRLPVGEAKDGINYVRVLAEAGGTVRIEFGRAARETNLDTSPPFEMLHHVSGVPLDQLRATYEANT